MENPKRHLRIYFSDFFNTSPKKIETYGAFNISLINDLPLFVDPFLLFNSEDETFKKLHTNIIKYMLFLKKKSSLDLPSGLIKAWYLFPEVKQNWFGFSKAGNSGRGLGPSFAKSLQNNFKDIFSDFGNEPSGSTHLGKLTLVKHGVGKDQISDFTCNLIHGFLAEYTQKFALENISPEKLQTFRIPKAEFNYLTETWNSKQYTLPKYGTEYVLLTPIDILTKDEAWISHKGFLEDFSRVISSIPNDQLRDQITLYLTKVMPAEPTKEEQVIAYEKTTLQYPALMDTYVNLRELDKETASTSSLEKVKTAQKLFQDQLRQFVDLVDKTAFYNSEPNSYEAGMQRVVFLKHVIEKQDGYRLFYVKGIPISRESDLQIMFKLTWFASKFSSDSEVNNGRGPADFLISYGSKDKSIIEFKLAKNSHMEKNIKNQAKIYSDASKATHPPIMAILYFNQTEANNIKRILTKNGLSGSKHIILIDASPKDSASKV
ncbi:MULTISPECIES: hypothetical protein [Pseudomonas]|nr:MULTISPECIES: hypothetical protein [Pseudomonas]AZC30475.1 hypothetical protein C4K38_2515 [Pseudomonas chlororaphis subsp. piscium]AZC50124.1 hypothetical protein C4K35_2541 [Pseudomonas chlororaphis subsp. piscium]AZD91904.1 hypothetical protein C4K13_2487 [Pseudomonas chlororaphis subsp. aureofaciens]KAB0531180.1 hypothetical protein F7R16_16785 [Pseudomonas chlororaphis subsp. aureofaciens]TSD32212.1 hypothetical protein FCE86_022440 [Pseudomonas sp. ATCC 13985]